MKESKDVPWILKKLEEDKQKAFELLMEGKPAEYSFERHMFSGYRVKIDPDQSKDKTRYLVSVEFWHNNSGMKATFNSVNNALYGSETMIRLLDLFEGK